MRLIQGGGKDLPLGWDASLRANTRRSTHASSVWLRNSSGGSFSDSPSSIFIDRSELFGSSVPLGPHNITSIGISTSGLPPISDSVPYAVHMNDLDVIAEDAPIDLVEGKKRLRSTNVLVTDVSNLKDSQVANMVAPGVTLSKSAIVKELENRLVLLRSQNSMFPSHEFIIVRNQLNKHNKIYASNSQSHGPSAQNDQNQKGPVSIIESREEDLARHALHIQQQDEKIHGLARESEEATTYNDYIMRKLERALMQNRMLTDRNEEIRYKEDKSNRLISGPHDNNKHN
ncbi:hypothetical protein ACFE04_027184 [Oxalis oulophora]